MNVQRSFINHDLLGAQRTSDCEAAVFGRMAETPTIPTLTGWRLIWSDREGLSTNINIVREVMSMESTLNNIGGGL